MSNVFSFLVLNKQSTPQRFKFSHTRKPFFRTTTHKTASSTEEVDFDQTIESSNQQSLEDNLAERDTTELSDIAAALQEIQQAPLRARTITTGRTVEYKRKKLNQFYKDYTKAENNL